MKIYFLGTCSGTEPMAGMHQCSLVMEINGTNYWFDAGECCGYTAHTMGLDVTKTRALFVSHPHIDHIGGMPHLLFTMDKLLSRDKSLKLVHNNTLELYFPDPELLQAIKIVAARKGNPRFTLEEHGLQDGLLYEDENVRITAIHNNHLKGDGEDGVWHSYSFLIEAEGKRVVYSGDVRRPSELDPFLKEPCDLLIMETGHHKVKDVCEYATGKQVARLRFNHHGREIIGDRAAAETLVAQYAKESGNSITICHDGMVEEL
ncbi:MAG: ribonuclease Z [Clostridia bacterium]|nr:ribonuclease Z [Clostridia bacterium]